MSLLAQAAALLAADGPADLVSVSNFLKVVGAIGAGGLCLATWWIATKYHQSQVRLAKKKAKDADDRAATATAAVLQGPPGRSRTATPAEPRSRPPVP